MTFGMKISMLRKEKGWSQTELAKNLNTSVSVISRYERGEIKNRRTYAVKQVVMKQVILNIPDNKYLAFINHIKSKFAYIQIKEKKNKTKDGIEEDSTYETMLLSDKSLINRPSPAIAQLN